MIEKTQENVTTTLRQAYARAVKNAPRVDTDMAIELFKSLIQQDPAFKEARESLRDFELKKTEAMTKGQRTGATLSTLIPVIKGMLSVKKDPIKAMNLAEDALAKCLDNPLALKLLAQAATNAEAPFVAIPALNTALHYRENDDSLLRKLAECYLECGRPAEAASVLEKLFQKHPQNGELRNRLREALAAASIEQGTGDSKNNQAGVQTRDSEEAVLQQLMDGSIHDADQANMIIEKFEKMLAEKESADIRRRLAEAYIIAGQYDTAIENLEKVAKTIGSSDAALDKNIERAQLGKFDMAIKELTNNPEAYENAAEQLAQLKQQRAEFQLQRTKERSEKYPNDLQLHYDLAVLYFDMDMYDDALEQFQSARKHPQRRIISQYYLGRCFAYKGLVDMAIEQLQGAISAMEVMDRYKEEAIYYLGRVYEDTGKTDEALKCYKELYQINISFMDVAVRIEKLYKK